MEKFESLSDLNNYFKKDYVVGLKRIQSDLHVNQKNTSEIVVTFTIHARAGKQLTEAQKEFVDEIKTLLNQIWNEYDEPISDDELPTRFEGSE